MTRVAGENTRLRHYSARPHRKPLCYSQSVEMLAHSIRLLLHELKFEEFPVPARFISRFSNARSKTKQMSATPIFLYGCGAVSHVEREPFASEQQGQIPL